MPADRILECPFCGNAESLKVCGYYDQHELFCVTCWVCQFDGPKARVKGNAIELWNRRTGTVYNGKIAFEWYTLYCQEVLKKAKACQTNS